MTDLQIRPWLMARAHAQLQAYGHRVTHIRWDADGQEGSGTCIHCGDGVLLYYDPQPEQCSIEGTAIATLCPGGSCAHGWRVVQRGGIRVMVQCVHCGVERAAAEMNAITE